MPNDTLRLADLPTSAIADEARPGLVLISIGDLTVEATTSQLATLATQMASAAAEATRLHTDATRKLIAQA